MLVARVKTHLAQVERLQPSPAEPAVLTVGPLTAKLDARQIFKNGVELPLKNREYELLLFLMRHPGQVFSREDLYEMIWGLESMGDNITVAVHIGRIREKLEDDPAEPQFILTKPARSSCRLSGASATGCARTQFKLCLKILYLLFKCVVYP